MKWRTEWNALRWQWRWWYHGWALGRMYGVISAVHVHNVAPADHHDLLGQICSVNSAGLFHCFFGTISMTVVITANETNETNVRSYCNAIALCVCCCNTSSAEVHDKNRIWERNRSLEAVHCHTISTLFSPLFSLQLTSTRDAARSLYLRSHYL